MSSLLEHLAWHADAFDLPQCALIWKHGGVVVHFEQLTCQRQWVSIVFDWDNSGSDIRIRQTVTRFEKSQSLRDMVTHFTRQGNTVFEKD